MARHTREICFENLGDKKRGQLILSPFGGVYGIGGSSACPLFLFRLTNERRGEGRGGTRRATSRCEMFRYCPVVLISQ